MRCRNSHPTRLVVLVVSLGLSSTPLLRGKLSPQENEQQRAQRAAEKREKQQLQAQKESTARQYVAEGEKLERENHLLEAQYEYQDAEQVTHTTEASKALKRVNNLIESRINRLVTDAHGLYERGHPEDYDSAIKKLKGAQEYDPDRLLLNYDLAIVNRASGNPIAAIDYLDQCLYGLPEGRKRDELEQLRAQIVTPQNVPHVTSTARATLVKIDKLRQTDDKGFHSPEHDPTAGREPCTLLLSNLLIPQLPSVLFNKARCQETDREQQQAAQLLERYLDSATKALDREQEESHLIALRSLASFPTSQGEQVRSYYSEAARYMDVGRYDLASRELTQAEAAFPAYCESKWHLALFYKTLGDIARTRQYLGAYLQCAANAAHRDEAVATLESLDSRRAKYDLAVQDAREPLSQVVEAYLKNGVNTRQRYVRSRLDTVFRDLGQALSFFRLGIEVHELLATVYELTNNFRLAKRSFDVLWTQGHTVAFFDSDGRRIEIQGDHFRIVDAHHSDPPRIASSLEAGIPGQAVKRIEVHEGTIVLILKTGSSVSITPARLAMPGSLKGPLARKYTNQYARLFQRYLGVDPIVLGKEGLTHKEIAQIGWDVFAVAMSAYSVSQAAKTSQYTQNITNLLLYGQSAASVSYMVKDARTLLQQQHQIAQDAPFKTIPTRTARFEFREKF